MKGIKRMFSKLSKTKKILISFSLSIIICIILAIIPTLANFKNGDGTYTTAIWDGEVATSYKSGDGTKDNPFVISEGSHLAYFSLMLQEINYENVYFRLSNNIILNEGTLKYSNDEGIIYVLNNNVYYVEYYTNKYYNNPEKSGDPIGTLNLLSPLKNFKGVLDGGSHTIYGLYVTDSENEEVGLFTNLQGSISSLFIKNSVVYGGTIAGGIASSASNASLTNVLYNGFVSNKMEDVEKKLENTFVVSDIIVTDTEEISYISLHEEIPFLNGEMTSAKITGNYEIIGAPEEIQVKINNEILTNNSFEINLGEKITEDLLISAKPLVPSGATIKFTNLKYYLNYNYSITGGIIGKTENVILKNSINKAKVLGYHIAGGIIGLASGDLKIEDSYNIGNINSNNISGGLVGNIKNSNTMVEILRSYNSGESNSINNGGLLGEVNNATSGILMTNVFDASLSEYPISIVKDAAIYNSKNYRITTGPDLREGTLTQSFTNIEISDLYNKQFLSTNLSLKEYVDENNLNNNPNSVWVFGIEELPILYSDKQYSKIANLYVGNTFYDTYHNDLEEKTFANNITFSVEIVNDFNPVENISYYISNEKKLLTKEELNTIDSWVPYQGITTITEDNSYVIYARIESVNNEIHYLNTDILMLDLKGPDVIISDGINSWTTLKNDVEKINVLKATEYLVSSIDELSGVLSTEYYITNKVLSLEELNVIDTWEEYIDKISIYETGKYIIYIKSIDNSNNVKYVNTDIINYQGYIVDSITPGKANDSSFQDLPLHITNKSALTIKFSFNSLDKTDVGNKHNLVVNTLLPKGTELTIIDEIENKVYSYIISTTEDIYNYENSCTHEECIKYATYPFELFNEIGRSSISNYEEKNYINGEIIEEKFTIVADFANSKTQLNYNNISFALELKNNDNILVRGTLENSLKNVNIYSKVTDITPTSRLHLSTDYPGNEVLFNSTSSTEINLDSTIFHERLNELKILDTSFEKQKIGLTIKLIDVNNNIINRKQLKNTTFEVGSTIYYPDDFGIVRIPLGKATLEHNTKLIIKTSEKDNGLEEGSYKFIINNFVSNDGYYGSVFGEEEVIIPVSVASNSYKQTYGYDVNHDLADHIINKLNFNKEVTFNVVKNGYILNPNVRVSLYEKEQLTAYNQDYMQVNLQDYVLNELIETTENIYSFELFGSNTEIKLNYTPSKFKNSSYKLIFELYSGDKKIDTIKKYFIVK